MLSATIEPRRDIGSATELAAELVTVRAADLAAELDATLRAAKHLPAGWAREFAAVDRAAFVPARVWFDDGDSRPQPIDRNTDPVRWYEAVYSDEPIVTQLDAGRTAWPATGRRPTSSASQPTIVLAMLDALDPRAGQRVLEIGTGTGYNTALLCERLGAQYVTSVEVDPVLTDRARAALAAAGYRPRVRCADGTTGWAAGAPYDRVLCTAAVMAGRVPRAWIRQTRPGGQIVTPWGTAYRNGVLVRLAVRGDGTASGPVLGEAAFMRLRDHDTPYGQAVRLGDRLDASGTATDSHTPVPPSDVATGHGAFAVGLRLPDVQNGVFYDDPDHYEVLLFHVPSGSVASATVSPASSRTGRYPVRQHGPRRLWDEAEAAHAWWVGLGRPAQTRFGLTVSPTREGVWLDDPASDPVREWRA